MENAQNITDNIKLIFDEKNRLINNLQDNNEFLKLFLQKYYDKYIKQKTEKNVIKIDEYTKSYNAIYNNYKYLLYFIKEFDKKEQVFKILNNLVPSITSVYHIISTIQNSNFNQNSKNLLTNLNKILNIKYNSIQNLLNVMQITMINLLAELNHNLKLLKLIREGNKKNKKTLIQKITNNNKIYNDLIHKIDESKRQISSIYNIQGGFPIRNIRHIMKHINKKHLTPIYNDLIKFIDSLNVLNAEFNSYISSYNDLLQKMKVFDEYFRYNLGFGKNINEEVKLSNKYYTENSEYLKVLLEKHTEESPHSINRMVSDAQHLIDIVSQRQATTSSDIADLNTEFKNFKSNRNQHRSQSSIHNTNGVIIKTRRRRKLHWPKHIPENALQPVPTVDKPINQLSLHKMSFAPHISSRKRNSAPTTLNTTDLNNKIMMMIDKKVPSSEIRKAIDSIDNKNNAKINKHKTI